MLVSLIFAMDEHNAIGVNNTLPWHLPADLKKFKQDTMGHHIIMGRKTYESIGRPLPGRTSIVVSRQEDYSAEGVKVAPALEQALHIARKAGETEAFIIGGAQLFRDAMPLADRFYLTRIHHTFTADTYLPAIDMREWEELERKDFQPDEKNKYPYSFITLKRKA